MSAGTTLSFIVVFGPSILTIPYFYCNPPLFILALLGAFAELWNLHVLALLQLIFAKLSYCKYIVLVLSNAFWLLLHWTLYRALQHVEAESNKHDRTLISSQDYPLPLGVAFGLGIGLMKALLLYCVSPASLFTKELSCLYRDYLSDLYSASLLCSIKIFLEACWTCALLGCLFLIASGENTTPSIERTEIRRPLNFSLEYWYSSNIFFGFILIMLIVTFRIIFVIMQSSKGVLGSTFLVIIMGATVCITFSVYWRLRKVRHVAPLGQVASP